MIFMKFKTTVMLPSFICNLLVSGPISEDVWSYICVLGMILSHILKVLSKSTFLNFL